MRKPCGGGRAREWSRTPDATGALGTQRPRTPGVTGILCTRTSRTTRRPRTRKPRWGGRARDAPHNGEDVHTTPRAMGGLRTSKLSAGCRGAKPVPANVDGVVVRDVPPPEPPLTQCQRPSAHPSALRAPAARHFRRPLHSHALNDDAHDDPRQARAVGVVQPLVDEPRRIQCLLRLFCTSKPKRPGAGKACEWRRCEGPRRASGGGIADDHLHCYPGASHGAAANTQQPRSASAARGQGPGPRCAAAFAQ